MAETAKKEIKNETIQKDTIKKDSEKVLNENIVILKNSKELTADEINKFQKFPIKLVARTYKDTTFYTCIIRFSDHVIGKIKDFNMSDFYLSINELKALKMQMVQTSLKDVESYNLQNMPVRSFHLKNSQKDYKAFDLFLSPNCIFRGFFKPSEWILVQNENKQFTYLDVTDDLTQNDEDNNGVTLF